MLQRPLNDHSNVHNYSTSTNSWLNYIINDSKVTKHVNKMKSLNFDQNVVIN